MSLSPLSQAMGLMGLGMGIGLALAYFGGMALWAAFAIFLFVVILCGEIARTLTDKPQTDWHVTEKEQRGDAYS